MPVYYAIRAMLATMLTGDLAANLRTARALARVYARFEPRRVRRTMDTLGVAFPDMPEADRHEHALRAYEHLFVLGVEMCFTPRLVTPDTWPDHLRLGNLDRAVRPMLSGPCVMITGHCGNWELLGYAMALLGFPFHALYRPLDLAPMDQWVRQTRGRRGLILVDKYGAMEQMPRLMAESRHVAFIADQNAGDRGLFVPFFNRLASTYKSIGLLALQYRAPIVCGQARRLVSERDARREHDVRSVADARDIGFDSYGDKPLQYRVDVLDVITPEEWERQPDPLFYVSARYRRSLEQMVRKAPEQNLWLHRYWKSRPRHEHTGRPFPASLRARIRALPWITDDDIARIEDWSARDAAELRSGPRKPSAVPAPVTTAEPASAAP